MGTIPNFMLVALPVFLLMGEIQLRVGLSDRLNRALNVRLSRLPGVPPHTNITSCAVVSAISGSSVATAPARRSVALPYFNNSACSQRMVLGFLATGHHPHHLRADHRDIAWRALYRGAAVPAAGDRRVHRCDPHIRADPPDGEAGSAATDTQAAGINSSDRGCVADAAGLDPAAFATPTEAAALAVPGAAAFAAIEDKLSFHLLNASAEATARNTAWLGPIIFGAYMSNSLLRTINLSQTLAGFISGPPLPPWAIMACILALYPALCTSMEGFSMMVTTVPVAFPTVAALGYDPIWFGVMVTMLIEIAPISPPDGTVMYVLQGMRPKPGPVTGVFVGVTPFLAAYLLAVVLLMVWPGIALWLRRVMG